jgi:hypothetical protein
VFFVCIFFCFYRLSKAFNSHNLLDVFATTSGSLPGLPIKAISAAAIGISGKPQKMEV